MNNLYPAFLQILIFQICIIFIFSLFYFFLKHQFMVDERNPDNPTPSISYYDCLLLSSTVQAGVGITTIFPNTNSTKLILTIQQWISILTGLYVVLTFKQVVLK